MAKSKTIQRPKNFYCEIPVAPEDIERFKKGCSHYGFTIEQKRGQKPYFTVGFNDPVDLYWFGANMFGHIETNGITKRAF
jgi:hypothetical protein